MIITDTSEGKQSSKNGALSTQESKDKLTFLQSLASIINSGMGNGALMMPYIFSQVGYLIALALLMMNGIIVSFFYFRLTLILDHIPTDENLTQSQRNKPTYTLITAMKIYIGRKSKVLSEFISYTYLVTGSITYFLFIKNQLKFLFEDAPSPSTIAASASGAGVAPPPNSSLLFPVLLVAITCPIFLRLMNMKNLEKLAKFFHLGVLACVIVNFFTIFFSITTILEKGFDKNAMQILDTNVTFKEVANVFGAIIFCYDVNGTLTEIRAEMGKPSQFKEIIKAYVLFMYLIMAITGSLGYMAFGNSNDENIIATLELNGMNQSLCVVLRILFSAGLFSSIILYLYPVQQIFEKKIEERDLSRKDQDLMKLFCLTALYMIVAISGINFDSATRIFNLQGSIFSVFLGFICPYLLFSHHPNYLNNKQEQIKSKLVLTISIIGGIIGIYASIS